MSRAARLLPWPLPALLAWGAGWALFVFGQRLGLPAWAALALGTLAILGCVYLLYSLPGTTLFRFCIWNVIGLALYAAYGRRHSFARRGVAA